MNAASNGSAGYQGKAFTVDGKPVYIFSGEFHYFRTPRGLWKDRAIKCRQLNLNTVASYIPWNWHEQKPGEYAFDGEKDIGAFVDEIADQEMFFLPRPGPYICSEWDSGSVPQWLQESTRFFRTLDPSFMQHVARWYDHVNQHFVPRLRSKDGNIIIYQIENEDWWCDKEYALALLDLVRGDGIDCPVITNEHPKVRGTEIIDTLDDYPLPWQPNSPYMFIPDGMEGKIRKLLKSQPDKPPMHTEFETGWYQEFGTCSPSKWLGDVPAEWIEVLMKSVIAEGINAINMYMVTGGFNYGYWGSKNCTTGRDWIAPIHEWGECNESFFNIRRIGSMLKTYGETLVTSEVDESLVQDPEEKISVFARRKGDSVFLAPRSLSGEGKEFRFSVPNADGSAGLEFPQRTNYNLRGETMAILPVNLTLHPQMPTLLYSTAEILGLYEAGQGLILVVSGDQDQEVELAFKSRMQVSGDVQSDHTEDGTVLFATVDAQPQAALLQGAEKPIQVLFVNKEIAGRTWELQTAEGTLPLLSNLYLLREDRLQADGLCITAESEPGMELQFYLPGEKPPAAVRINAQDVPVAFDPEQNLASFSSSIEEQPLFVQALEGEWEWREEPIGEQDSRDWRPYTKWRGLEQHGEQEKGYFEYRTQFEAPKDRVPLTLNLTRVWDEVSVFVNGQYIGAGRDRFVADISEAVHWGEVNDLLIVLEFWGRWEHGFAEENGIPCPVVLNSQEEALDIISWKRNAVGTYAEPWLLDSPPPEATPAFDDSGWKDVEVRKSWDSRIHGSWRGKEYFWYRTRVDVPESFRGKHVRLDFGECRDECWIYANGKFVRWFNWFRVPGEPFSVDLTDYIEAGRENQIAVLVLVKWHGQGALHQSMRLVACENLVEGDWSYTQGLRGEKIGIPQGKDDLQGWERMELKGAFTKTGDHDIVWLRTSFDLDLPQGWVIPLAARISGFEKKVNMYLNGHFLGRYRSEGPQEKFYIPEPWLQENDNKLVLMVDGWKPGIRLGEIGLESYPPKKQVEIEIKL